MDTVGERKSGTNGESSIDIYTHPCVRQSAGEKLLHNTGSPAWCPMMTWRGGVGGGRETQEEGDACIIMAHLRCTAENNTTM